MQGKKGSVSLFPSPQRLRKQLLTKQNATRGETSLSPVRLKGADMEEQEKEYEEKPADRIMLLNMKAVKDYIRTQRPELRCSDEFLKTLNSIVKERVAKACRRNRSLNRNTLKKDELFM